MTTDTTLLKTPGARPLAQILQEHSEGEAKLYYTGLPSKPLLIARSRSITTPWKDPGPEAYGKELGPIGNHALSSDVGENKYVPDILRLLESQGVMLTSVDLLRIANSAGPSSSAPVILWIGVTPKTLTPL